MSRHNVTANMLFLLVIFIYISQAARPAGFFPP